VEKELPVPYERISTETMPSQIAKQIREAILDGRLAVDERLPTEEQLAVQFGVSRPTIREALKRLAAHNLVRSRRGPAGGSFVNAPTLLDARGNLAAVTTMLVGMGQFSLEQISAVRLSLELLCAQLSVDNRSDDQLALMEAEIALQGDETITDQEFCASDVRLHGVFADSSGNALLRFIMASVIEALQPVSNLVVFKYRQRTAIADQHQRLLDALRSRNRAACEAVLAEQSLYLQERYAEAQAVIRARNTGRE